MLTCASSAGPMEKSSSIAKQVLRPDRVLGVMDILHQYCCAKPRVSKYAAGVQGAHDVGTLKSSAKPV